MPPHFFPTEATLDEVLFVLGEPLSEDEVWSVLYSGSVALIKYFEVRPTVSYPFWIKNFMQL